MSLLLAASPFGLAFFLLLCRWPTRTVGLFTFGSLLLVILLEASLRPPSFPVRRSTPTLSLVS